MAFETEFFPAKTYKTKENCVAAIDRKFVKSRPLRYMVVCTEDGRFAPVFFGKESVDIAMWIAGHGWTVVG